MNTKILERYAAEMTELSKLKPNGCARLPDEQRTFALEVLTRMHTEVVCELIGIIDVARAIAKEAAAAFPDVMKEYAEDADAVMTTMRDMQMEIAQKQNPHLTPEAIAAMAIARAKMLESKVVELRV